MVDFTQKIDFTVDSTSYESIRYLHSILEEAVNIMQSKINLKCPSVRVDFFFSANGLNCSCDNIDKFIENAYGVTDFRLLKYSISLSENYDHVIYVHYGFDLSVTANDRKSLEQFVNLLFRIKDNKERYNNDLLKQTVIQGPVFNSVIGDSNVLINKGNVTQQIEPHNAVSLNWMDRIKQSISDKIVHYAIVGIIALLTFIFVHYLQ